LQLLLDFLRSHKLVELLDGVPAEQSLNAGVAKCDINECLEKVAEILGFLILDVLGLRMLDERQDHDLGDGTLN